MLLLHGFPQTSRSWREQLPVLAGAGYRAVAPDQGGYSPGARPPDVDAYELDHLVADVVGFAAALGCERFHLVGHDWGGQVAWMTAACHPVRSSTTCAGTRPGPRPSVEGLFDVSPGPASP